MTVIESGNNAAGVANVDTAYNVQVNLPGRTAAGVLRGGGEDNAGVAVMFVENDGGSLTGARFVRSPEVDSDYRLRIAHDNLLDHETFNYVAQNTGKHSHAFTTLTATVSAAGLLLNSGNITTTATGMTFGTHAEFPVGVGAQAAYFESSVAFSASAAPANVTVDIGAFRRGAATAYAPTDGAYFRFTSAGLVGVINRGGVETQTSPFTFTPVANQNYLLTISLSEKRARFWVDDVHLGSIENAGAGQPFISASLPWSVRHAIVGGAAGGAFQTTISDYTVSLGGAQYADDLGAVSNRTLGSYQGLSGGTMGSLANYANSTNPAAAVPTNTTAALGTGLGGQFAETDTLAAGTDGIIMSYQVPAGTTAVQGRRLRINGVRIDSAVLTAISGGGGVSAAWTLCFGHTAVSLATAETASFVTGTTKARRVVPLGMNSYNAANVGAGTSQSPIDVKLVNPVFVNPGEFVAVAKKKIGAVPTAGAWLHLITLDYSWE